MSVDKAEVYLERSKSSPINLWLSGPVFHDPFFRIILRAIQRLRSLTFNGAQRYQDEIATDLSRPMPLLERLSMVGRYKGESNSWWPHPVLTSAHFDRALPSLRMLCLKYVTTELSWRRMVNLTSLKLVQTFPVSIKRLLDFFESAPRLCEVELHFAVSTSGV